MQWGLEKDNSTLSQYIDDLSAFKFSGTFSSCCTDTFTRGQDGLVLPVCEYWATGAGYRRLFFSIFHLRQRAISHERFMLSERGAALEESLRMFYFFLRVHGEEFVSEPSLWDIINAFSEKLRDLAGLSASANALSLQIKHLSLSRPPSPLREWIKSFIRGVVEKSMLFPFRAC